ncbi:uncharacterized protein LOC114130428 [Aphis gossypii]|uniref:uncharacterized protein LOC114130428 n=1 Tax=Aphis gossypii TaxID=80765 RepID=UPI002158DBA7|nr:uncharacterized protein LOC114130428 [Aphis gossypii]XP_050054162.1 uncharacterized protein LOC114130428 [Aphis gossypii]XP_050054163.1 uncharacterized protein LOC114130428 [Aphis gossypii]
MDLIRYDCAPERSLIIVTILYTAALTVSTSNQNTLVQKSTCDPLVPFGECLLGEYEGQRQVASNITYLQYSISFVVALLAGAWSDSHGRRRKPLIFLPIIGQILTDGLYFVNNFWYWTSTFNIIFTAVIPGLYVGRNMFWIGVMSYVSENSKFEGRTLKHGIIIATYTFSLLIGWGLIIILKKSTDRLHRYLLFVVPILFNLFAILIGQLYIEDNSDTYDRDIIWFRPNSVFKGFIDLFKNKFKGFSIVLATLIICQSVIVARIGSEYEIIMQYISKSFMWYHDDHIYFSVIKMLAIIFGTMFSVFVLSYNMKIHDLAIGISACIIYIIAAILYIVSNQFWQIFIISMIYLCHGSAVTITISLTSKIMDNDQLGRFYSIQTCMNTALTFGLVKAYETATDNRFYSKFGHFCLMILMYVILTIPILFVFIILYSKYKNFWIRDTARTSRTRQQTVYVIST